MPTMPNIVGRDLQDATAMLEAAGVIDLSQIGYFGTWPIGVDWQTDTDAPSNSVLSQEPAPGSIVDVNPNIVLDVSGFPISVIYP